MPLSRRALLAAPALIATPALAAWPERPVTIIIPFGPGSSQDVLARLMAPHLTRAWGQPVVVNNIVGAAGTIGVDRVAKSPPDGLTLTLTGDASIVVRVSMSPRPPYDPVADLAPISQLGRTPNVLVVSNVTPYTSLAQLVAAAKAAPGAISFAHIGAGTSQHIGGELLNMLAGIELNGVAYNDGGAQLQDVIAGRATMTFASVVTALPRLRDGSFRALGVSSPERVPALPDIPTIAEQGFSGFDAVAWLGLFARAGTPPEIVNKVNAAMNKAIANPAVRDTLERIGAEVQGGTPADFGAFVKAQVAQWEGVVKQANIKMQ
jgi:tripartite-type tricarboxylate transporter receptor subunit TctC